MDSGDPTNSIRFSGCDDVFSTDGSLDFSNIAPTKYKEPDWKRSLSQDIQPETLVTVQTILPEESSTLEGDITIQAVLPTSPGNQQVFQGDKSPQFAAEVKPKRHSPSSPSQEGVVAAVQRRSSRMERRMHPHALKPHMRSQSVPEQRLGSSGTSFDDEEEGSMWMSVSRLHLCYQAGNTVGSTNSHVFDV